MRCFLSTVFLMVCCFSSYAQTPEEDFTDWVAFKVKSIDDFFERFNGEKNTELSAYIAANYPEKSLTRQQWIISLFNREDPGFMTDSGKVSFIRQVTDSLHPQFLDYKDNYWYAWVDGHVVYKGKRLPITMVLKVKKSPGGAYSWSIVSAHAAFLSNSSAPNMKADSLSADSTQKYFLSPVSHGIDFITLDKFFKSRSKVRNYLHQQKNTPETEKLIGMISRGELQFVQVRKIRYYLLQMKGWIVEIDYFNRPGRNTGWLINRLLPVSPDGKRSFMVNNLYIPMNK
jgi:hypothetical protein